MGYSKIIRESAHKVRIVHQLNSDGTPYAEDITVETAESVDERRLDYLRDGEIGYASVQFTRTEVGVNPASLKFPE